MNIWLSEARLSRRSARVALILCGLMAGLPGPVQAGVEGDWRVAGILDVLVKLKGKSVKTTDRAHGPYTLVFKPEGRAFRMLDSKTSLLTGEWLQQARRFSVKLDRTAVSGFVKGIEKAEQLRSGLAVTITPLKTTLSGTQRPDGGIEGILKIQARAGFPAFGSATGKLSLNYRFTGSTESPAP